MGAGGWAGQLHEGREPPTQGPAPSMESRAAVGRKQNWINRGRGRWASCHPSLPSSLLGLCKACLLPFPFPQTSLPDQGLCCVSQASLFNKRGCQVAQPPLFHDYTARPEPSQTDRHKASGSCRGWAGESADPQGAKGALERLGATPQRGTGLLPGHTGPL